MDLPLHTQIASWLHGLTLGSVDLLAGEVLGNSEEIEDLQPISVGTVCNTGQFICRSFVMELEAT